MNRRRDTVNSNYDQKIFSRTAVKTKNVNVNPTNMRGGVRL